MSSNAGLMRHLHSRHGRQLSINDKYIGIGVGVENKLTNCALITIKQPS
jgi:hypothetical protein